VKYFIFFTFIAGYLFAQEEGINVKGKKESYQPTQISGQEARQTAGTLGEPLRVLETLPGVSLPSFLGGEIIIRGANPNSNSYFIDDIPISYPFHYLGLNSVISNYLWDSLVLETGAYSSIYNNAIGGVLALTTKMRITKPEKYLSVSLFSSHVHIESKPSEKHELTTAARVNYMRETYGRLDLVQSGIRLPSYNDIQIKYQYIFDKFHSFQFYNFISNDSFSLDFSENSDNANSLITGGRLAQARGFRTTAFRHTYATKNIQHRLTLIDFYPWEKVNGELGDLKADFTESFGYKSLRQDLDWNISRRGKLKQGTEIRKLEYETKGFTVLETKPEKITLNPFNTNDPDYKQRSISESIDAFYYSGYLEYSQNFDKLRFLAGLRYDGVNLVGQSATTPRIRLEYFYSSVFSFFARGGETSRLPLGNELSKKTGNPKLGFEKNISSGLGWRYLPTFLWEMQVEIFDQHLRNLVVRDSSVGEYFVPNLAPDVYGAEPLLAFRPSFFSNTGSGSSQGVEFFLRKKNLSSKVLSWGGWISYTYSETKRRSNQHEPLRDDYSPEENVLFSRWNNSKENIYEFDQRHIFNLVLSFVPKVDWQLGVRWQYRSSFPYTEIIGDDGGKTRNPYNNQRVYFPVYSDNTNAMRLPPYHRLDLRIDRIFPYQWGYMNYYLEFINLYARTNYVERQFKSGRPFSEFNPTFGQDPAILPLRNLTNLPLINFGLEVRF
jgi:hypothetical protein